MKEVTVWYREQGGASSRELLRLAASRFTGLGKDEFSTVPLPLPTDGGADAGEGKRYRKPAFLLHPELFASVSHSGGVWACALTYGGPVGLDVQVLTRPGRLEGIVGRYFHPEEAGAVLSAPDRTAAFLRIWCRKEAAVKQSGRGIDGQFARFSAVSSPADVLGQELYLTDFDLPGFPEIFCCAALGSPFDIRTQRF